MSGWDAFFTLDRGQVREAASIDEFWEWHRRNPGGRLLSTTVLGQTVETIFTGRHSRRAGFNDKVEPFESFVLGGSLYGARGANQWEGALYEHNKMVDAVVHRWFCTFQKDAASVPRGPLFSPTSSTEIAKRNGCVLPTPSIHSVHAPPTGPASLRWRLLHALFGKSLNWFEINRAIVTTPDRCLDAMTAAWSEGLLSRKDSSDHWQPPTFSLSALGEERLRKANFAVTFHRDMATTSDAWQPGWETWMFHGCPVCGGFLGLTGGGGLVCVADACQPGQAHRDRHYNGVLKDGQLVEATAHVAELELYVSYAENRHEKRRAGNVLRAASGTPSDEQIRNYVCSAFA